MRIAQLIKEGFFDPPKTYEIDIDLLTPEDKYRIVEKMQFRIAIIEDDRIFEFNPQSDGSCDVKQLPVSLRQTGAMANKSVENMIEYFGCVSTYKKIIFREKK